MKEIQVKRLIAALAISFWAMPAYAEKIDTVAYARAGGTVDRFLQITESALGDMHGKRIVFDNCAAATEYIKTTERPTLSIGYPDTQIKKENNPCLLDRENFYGHIAASPAFICVREEKAEGAIEKLLNDTSYVGYSNFLYAKIKVEALEDAVPNLKMIPYKNSGAGRAALVAGEIDFLITGTSKDGEKCPVILDTEINFDAEITAIELFPAAESAATFKYILFMFGSNLPNNKDIVNMIQESDAWENRVDVKYTEYLNDMSLDQQFIGLQEF